MQQRVQRVQQLQRHEPQGQQQHEPQAQAQQQSRRTLLSRRVMRSRQAGLMAGICGNVSGFFSTFSKVASRRAPL